MITSTRFNLFVIGLTLGLVGTGCEVDLNSGRFDAQATGTERYADNTTSVYDRPIQIDVQLGQDAGGVRPDVLVFTFCEDTIDSPLWLPCFEPIEVAVRQNHFGGEGYNWGSFTVDTDDDYPLYCDIQETVVISGDLEDEDHFTLSFSYSASLNYADPACLEAFDEPTYVSFEATATRQGVTD